MHLPDVSFSPRGLVVLAGHLLPRGGEQNPEVCCTVLCCAAGANFIIAQRLYYTILPSGPLLVMYQLLHSTSSVSVT